MGTIGGWWLASIPTLPKEAIVASYSTNQLRREQRPLGGKLYLTNYRLVFCPHLFDAYFGGAVWEADLETIEAVELIDPRSTDAVDLDENLGGGRERRLRIATQDGDEGYFIVKNIERVKAAIDAAVATSKS